MIAALIFELAGGAFFDPVAASRACIPLGTASAAAVMSESSKKRRRVMDFIE
jgi:hypothetical protein